MQYVPFQQEAGDRYMLWQWPCVTHGVGGHPVQADLLGTLWVWGALVGVTGVGTDQAEQSIGIEDKVCLVGVDVTDDGVHASDLVVAGNDFQVVVDPAQV